MNPASTSFVLGYHGCDQKLAESVFAGRSSLAPSTNDYDWLGHGIYFWEHNARRAFEFATEIWKRTGTKRQKIKKPAVVGAIIDLGECLNLLDSRFLTLIQDGHRELVELFRDAGEALPTNAVGPDMLLRKLDCAVIELLHAARTREGLPPFDSVRAAFIEGKALYPNAGFRHKNHIQICVRNPACIKGYFRPIDESGRPLVFA